MPDQTPQPPAAEMVEPFKGPFTVEPWYWENAERTISGYRVEDADGNEVKLFRGHGTEHKAQWLRDKLNASTPTPAEGERDAFAKWFVDFYQGDAGVPKNVAGAAFYAGASWQARATLTPSAAEGWVCVPAKEMTDAMMDAGQAYLDARALSLSGRFVLPGTFNWHQFWTAVLAAAPASPSPGVLTAREQAIIDRADKRCRKAEPLDVNLACDLLAIIDKHIPKEGGE